jgi:hypothetical protein
MVQLELRRCGDRLNVKLLGHNLHCYAPTARLWTYPPAHTKRLLCCAGGCGPIAAAYTHASSPLIMRVKTHVSGPAFMMKLSYLHGGLSCSLGAVARRRIVCQNLLCYMGPLSLRHMLFVKKNINEQWANPAAWFACVGGSTSSAYMQTARLPWHTQHLVANDQTGPFPTGRFATSRSPALITMTYFPPR